MWYRTSFMLPADAPTKPIRPPAGPYWHLGDGFMLAYLPPDTKAGDWWPAATNIIRTPFGRIQFGPSTPRPDWWIGEGEEYVPDMRRYAPPPLDES